MRCLFEEDEHDGIAALGLAAYFTLRIRRRYEESFLINPLFLCLDVIQLLRIIAALNSYFNDYVIIEGGKKLKFAVVFSCTPKSRGLFQLL